MYTVDVEFSPQWAASQSALPVLPLSTGDQSWSSQCQRWRSGLAEWSPSPHWHLLMELQPISSYQPWSLPQLWRAGKLAIRSMIRTVIFWVITLHFSATEIVVLIVFRSATLEFLKSDELCSFSNVLTTQIYILLYHFCS